MVKDMSEALEDLGINEFKGMTKYLMIREDRALILTRYNDKYLINLCTSGRLGGVGVFPTPTGLSEKIRDQAIVRQIFDYFEKMDLYDGYVHKNLATKWTELIKRYYVKP